MQKQRVVTLGYKKTHGATVLFTSQPCCSPLLEVNDGFDLESWSP